MEVGAGLGGGQRRGDEAGGADAAHGPARRGAGDGGGDAPRGAQRWWVGWWVGGLVFVVVVEWGRMGGGWPMVNQECDLYALPHFSQHSVRHGRDGGRGDRVAHGHRQGDVI